MANENFNLENLLNGFSNQNFENYQKFVDESDESTQDKDFQEFFSELDEPTQDKITNILENLPNIKGYSERFKSSLINCYKLLTFNINNNGVFSEDIDIIVDGELILKELRDKGYISPEESNELSQFINELSNNDLNNIRNNNAKEFINFLKENLNNDSLIKDNSFLFEVGKKLLEKNSSEILEDRLNYILKILKGSQPKQYNQFCKVLNDAKSNGKYEEIGNALIEIYEKDKEFGTEILDKVLDAIVGENIEQAKEIIDKYEKQAQEIIAKYEKQAKVSIPNKPQQPLKKRREPKKPQILQKVIDEANKLKMQHKKKNAQIIQNAKV